MLKIIKNGIFKENPTFIQVLGMCPTLAVTTSLSNGIGMGLSTTAVLVASNIAISVMRKIIPDKIRIASYVVIISGFVSVIEMLLKAYLPQLSQTLGIYIPLIVVNCIILARAEAFASKNSVMQSAADGIGIGLGFTCALIIISSVREVLGSGTLNNIPLFGADFQPALIMTMAPGGFLTLGLILGIIGVIASRKKA